MLSESGIEVLVLRLEIVTASTPIIRKLVLAIDENIPCYHASLWFEMALVKWRFFIFIVKIHVIFKKNHVFP